MKYSLVCYASFFAGTLLSIGAPSQAATINNLFSMDLNSAGDGLLTLDNTTGLKWLNLTETFGRSVEDGAIPGFRLATFEEVDDLFDGLPPAPDPRRLLESRKEIAASYPGGTEALIRDTQDAMSFLGFTDFLDVDFLNGITPPQESGSQVALFYCATTTPASAFGCGNRTITPEEQSEFSESIGVFMVQASVNEEEPVSTPEPSILAALGLLAISTFGLKTVHPKTLI